MHRSKNNTRALWYELPIIYDRNFKNISNHYNYEPCFCNKRLDILNISILPHGALDLSDNIRLLLEHFVKIDNLAC